MIGTAISGTPLPSAPRVVFKPACVMTSVDLSMTFCCGAKADDQRISGQTHVDVTNVSPAEGDHELHVQANARLGDAPENIRSAILQSSQRRIDERPRAECLERKGQVREGERLDA